MATVTHYIYSHYDPPKKPQSEIAEDSGSETEQSEQDPWQTESSFGAQRRLAAAPRFVPAIVSYDKINDMIGVKRDPPPREEEKSGDGVASWYKSLPRSRSTTSSGAATPNSPNAQTPSVASGPKSASKSGPRIDKNNWFIRKAMLADTQSAPTTPPPSLADILSRELPTETDKRHKPPVFLALGPSNRGFSMLEKSGWREGETLGAHVAKRPLTQREKAASTSTNTHKIAASHDEERVIHYDDEGEVSEVRKVPVIDLTMSEDEDDVVEISDSEAESSPEPSAASNGVSLHDGVALLTPIATVLKSDRLGIGLKAKTVGPYKASKKRVTHSQAALSAHIRANENMQRLKKITGRGTRGFARIAQAESEDRRQLLASLHS